MEDFEKIEAEMRKIIKSNLPIERFTLPREEAIALMSKYHEPYKVELIQDLPEGEEISFYPQGAFTDLCRGPHLPSTGKIKAFKLVSIAGAYWRGDEKKKMLTRIYGTAFAKKDEMDEYFAMLEEAKKRDHIKLGKEMKLFALLPEGKGFPFFLPNGMILKNTLIDYWRQIHRREGYVEVQTPIILNRSLWETSGHWDHYKENMYTTKIDGEDCAIKPMNCPGGLLVYKTQPHSYKDLPIRMGELGIVHRHEKSGQLHGLMRVRCFTQDDAHIFMLPEQITQEIKGVVRIIDEVYKLFGFKYSRRTLHPSRKFHRQRRGLGGGDERPARRARRARAGLHRQRGRRRLLRPQDRLPPRGLHQAHLAVRHHSAGLPAPAAL